ncbi:histidine kinase, partial [Halorubrum sp. SD626R]
SRLEDREQELLDELPNDLDNETLLMTREVLVSLQHPAEYAMRNAEIAANLALNEASEHVEII